MSETAMTKPPGKLVLDESLDLTAAAGLARSLEPFRGTDLIVDAAAVKRLGTQSAQVLASAAATWAADGAEFRIVESSAEFTEVLRLLGMNSLLGIEERSL